MKYYNSLQLSQIGLVGVRLHQRTLWSKELPTCSRILQVKVGGGRVYSLYYSVLNLLTTSDGAVLFLVWEKTPARGE